jgi:hypothetical protein
MNLNWSLADGPNSLADNRRCSGRSNWGRHRLTLLTLFMVLSCLPSVRAQISASIKGIATDPSGAPLPSAVVKTKNLETGASRSGITDDAGRYLVLALPIGEYEVRVTKPGFQEAIRSGIHLVVGEEAIVDLRLQVGAVNSEITVTGDAPVVSTTTSDISGFVGEQAVQELPLNGRS